MRHTYDFAARITLACIGFVLALLAILVIEATLSHAPASLENTLFALGLAGVAGFGAWLIAFAITRR